MSEGFIYCFSNPSMPGILKVGMTERTPKERLSEANASDTWRPPTPYKIEFAKKVSNSSQKEKTLHILLEQYTDRINPRREFFRVSPEEVSKFFDLMDGEMWKDKRNGGDDKGGNDERNGGGDKKENGDGGEDTDDGGEDTDDGGEDGRGDNNKTIKGCRDMKKCFTNGQRIRHTIGINKTWIGVYNTSNNGVMYNGNVMTLNKFVVSHYEKERPDRTSNANAWKQCECEVDGKWISTYLLKPNL